MANRCWRISPSVGRLSRARANPNTATLWSVPQTVTRSHQRMYCEGSDGSKHRALYTRTGDKGTSVLLSMTRVSKDHVVFEAVGTIDELNNAVGIAREHCRTTFKSEEVSYVNEQLAKIQAILFDVGTHVAAPKSMTTSNVLEIATFDGNHVEDLESWIDDIDSKNSPLKNFILPGGGLSAANLHVARGVCRRAERRVVELVAAEEISPDVLKFLNRLSDYLFALARYASINDGREETIYKKVRPARRRSN